MSLILNSRLIATVVCIVIAGAAQGQAYPSKTVRIVTSGVGGAGDVVSRLIAQGISAGLGQQVIVDNRSSGAIPVEVAVKARPDGYTMLVYGSTVWLGPFLRANAPDPLRDLMPVTLAATAPNILVVHPSLPVKSIKELIALTRSKPGALNYGSYGIASMAQINIEALKARMGIDIVHIPYKGAGPAVQAVVAGEASLTITSPTAVLGFVREGKLRALALDAKKRSPLLPDVPTLAEAGGEEDTLVATYFAFALPAKTPRAVVDRLQDAMKRAVLSPEVAERLNKAGLEPTGGTGAELLELVKRDIPRFREIIQRVGIEAE